jgi:uncharacterized membrane protein YagU involved in acid resistance
MASIVALRVGVNATMAMICFVFLMAGVNKLTPALDAGTHAFLVESAKRYPEVLFLDKLGVDHVTLRVAIGSAEVLLAVALLTPAFFAAGLCLIFIMIGAIFTHVSLKESPLVPAVIMAIIFAFLTMSISLENAKAAAAPRVEPNANDKKES